MTKSPARMIPQFNVRIPPDTDQQKVSSLSAQEHQRAAELQRGGKQSATPTGTHRGVESIIIKAKSRRAPQ
jgi:muconolactone delta-isomerase